MSNRSGEVQTVFRDTWGAEPLDLSKVLEPLALPVTHVIFTYDTETNRCYSMGQCKKEVKSLETKARQNGLPDIPYNFIVGGDGFIYEGRGWQHKPEKHPKYDYLHGSSLEIAFIGDYRSSSGISSKTLAFGKQFVQLGKEMKHIVEDCKIMEANPLKLESGTEQEKKP